MLLSLRRQHGTASRKHNPYQYRIFSQGNSVCAYIAFETHIRCKTDNFALFAPPNKKSNLHYPPTKRELAGYDAGIHATDNESLKADLQAAFDRQSVLLKKQEAALKDFTKQTGLTRDRSREQVSAHFETVQGKTVAFNKSVSQKAVQANKRALQIEKEKRIIIEQETKRIRQEIANGKYPLTLNVGNQNKHIPTSHSYKPEDKKSYLFGDLNTAQELVNKYSGTGELKFNQKNVWTNKEFVNADIEIGMVFDEQTGKFQPTNRFSIHYGKKGTHIVPREKVKKR